MIVLNLLNNIHEGMCGLSPLSLFPDAHKNTCCASKLCLHLYRIENGCQPCLGCLSYVEYDCQ